MAPNYHSWFLAVGSAHRYFHPCKGVSLDQDALLQRFELWPIFHLSKGVGQITRGQPTCSVQATVPILLYFNTLPTKDTCARPWGTESSQKCFLPGFFCDITVPSSSFTGTTSTFSRLLWYHIYPVWFFLIGIYPTQSLQLACAEHKLPSLKSGMVRGKYLRRPVLNKCHFSLIHINFSVGTAVLLLYFFSLVPTEMTHAHLLS